MLTDSALTDLNGVSCPVFRESGCRYQSIAQYSDLSISVIDPQTSRYIEVNDNFCGRLEYTREEMLHASVGLINPSFPPSAITDLARQLKTRQVVQLHTTQRTKSGKLLDAYVTVSAIYCDERILIHCLSMDTTAQRRAERDLIESEKRFRLTFEQAAVAIAHVAPDGTWLRVNRKFCTITGYTPQELSRLTFGDITHPEDLDADWAQASALLQGKIATYSMEKRYIRKDGNSVWVNLTVSLACGEDGKPEYFISVAEDISARKRAEEQRDELIRTLEEQVRQRTTELERLSMTDPLTGVANRRALDKALASEWVRALRSHQTISVIAVDVDQLKTLNDRLGHSYGDECMVAIAGALRPLTARPSDLFARIGGDEFIFLLPGTDAAGARLLASRAQLAVRSLSLAFPGADRAIVTLSAGVASETPSVQRSPKDLLSAADRAMYQAKHQGRDRVCSIGEVPSVHHPW
jgi:diguanylate cyclase (GGDEF)-like protein/PAS domain S-box-containing protein